LRNAIKSPWNSPLEVRKASKDGRKCGLIVGKALHSVIMRETLKMGSQAKAGMIESPTPSLESWSYMFVQVVAAPPRGMFYLLLLPKVRPSAQ
jgi:hypothetical protein